MTTKPATTDYLLEQLSGAGKVTHRKMFGDYALYLDEKVIALVCDDQLFVKPTKAGADYLGTPNEAAPFKGAKNWYLITGDYWDDADWLCALIRVSLPEIPIYKKKPKKKKP